MAGNTPGLSYTGHRFGPQAAREAGLPYSFGLPASSPDSTRVLNERSRYRAWAQRAFDAANQDFPGLIPKLIRSLGLRRLTRLEIMLDPRVLHELRAALRKRHTAR